MRIQPQSVAFTALLGALAALPPLSIDMALPALSVIGSSLDASPAAVGLTLSVFLVGFATAQLAFGPIADRYGRRPTLLVGCTLFALAGLGCALSSSIQAVIAWRLVQGAGAGAASVLVRAIVRDLFDGPAARAQFSYVSLISSVAPMIAPTIGGLLLTLGGWRTIYAILGVGGTALTIIAALSLGESIRERDATALRPRRMFGNYARILGDHVTAGYALVNALSFGAIFTYVAASPQIFIGVLGVSTTLYGFLFATTALGIMAGAFLSGRLAIWRVPSHKPFIWSLTAAAIAAIALLPIAATGNARVTTLMPLLFICTFCYGVIVPQAVHGALQRVPEIAGVASATLGFLQMAIGAFASAVVALLFNVHPGVLTMASVMTAFALASLMLYRMVVYPAELRASAPPLRAANTSEPTENRRVA